MTPEQINKAIDKIVNPTPLVGLKKRGYWYRPNAAGYTDRVSEAGRYTQAEAKKLEYPRGDEPVTIQELPPLDYHGDLNACHQFETFLELPDHNAEQVQLNTYAAHLLRISIHSGNHYTWHSSAPQRCQAFLQTFGKWVQS